MESPIVYMITIDYIGMGRPRVKLYYSILQQSFLNIRRQKTQFPLIQYFSLKFVYSVSRGKQCIRAYSQVIVNVQGAYSQVFNQSLCQHAIFLPSDST